MRYVLFATLALLLVPTPADAGDNFSFFFGYSSGYPRYHFGGGYSNYHCAPFYPSYGYYRPYYGGFHGRYAVPKVYSPYRYGYGYGHHYAYRRGDHGYRRSLYHGGNSYYGPALERYHRDRSDYPSYHFNRREGYIRGQSYDRGNRYRR